MFKKLFAVGAILLLLAGCATLPQDREEKYGKAISVITQSFAAPEIRPGVTWKVYLKASDPDGDMKNLYAEVFQYGLGPYPLSITRVKEGDGRDLSGYFYLNTGDEPGMHFKNLILTVHIQDKAGHFSAPVKFSLAFNGAAPFVQPSPPAGVFQEKDLGPILVNLRSSNDGSGGPGFE
jgi:hypothetical protein